MRVEAGGDAWVGFATEQYNAEKETCQSRALVSLDTGTTHIGTDISHDGQEHCHRVHLRLHIPEAPFDLAVRCGAGGTGRYTS
jgi:hypothetical protein